MSNLTVNSNSDFISSIEIAISEYFKNIAPSSWSYESFLVTMKPYILLEDERELSAIWRKRFLNALKVIITNYKENVEPSKQVQQIASLLTNQKQTANVAKFWRNIVQEKNKAKVEEKLRYTQFIFKENSKIDALKILTSARTQQTAQLSGEINLNKQTISNDDIGIYGSDSIIEIDINTSCFDKSVIPEKRTNQEYVKNIFDDDDNNKIKCSKTVNKINLEHVKYDPKSDIVDLRPKSKFFKQLSFEDVQNYHKEIDEITEKLIPDHIHNFLIDFFSQKLSEAEWQNKIDDLCPPNHDDSLLVATTRIIRRTLPQFIKTFALGAFNPLLNIKSIEKPHLNAFVHPCLDAALWYIARINYEYGEIPSQNHVTRNLADGVGYMTSADKFQLVYVEGASPVAKEDKEIADAEKIAKDLRNMFNNIVKNSFNNRKCIPESLRVFGGQSFRLQIYLFYLDFHDKYHLHEVENANLPRDFSEIEDFVPFYECILKWALLVKEMTEKFEISRKNKRPSRNSYSRNVRLFEKLQKNSF
nr:9504_t:CDS:2 [Entrophospora candida]